MRGRPPLSYVLGLHFGRAILPLLFLWLLVQSCSVVFADDGDCARLTVAALTPDESVEETLLLVGNALVHGWHGIEKDPIEGALCIRDAAQRGHVDAQAKLGTLYGVGVGVPQDWMLAHMWLSLAIVHGYGDDEVRALRDRTADEKLTRAEVAESRRLVQEWLRDH